MNRQTRQIKLPHRTRKEIDSMMKKLVNAEKTQAAAITLTYATGLAETTCHHLVERLLFLYRIDGEDATTILRRFNPSNKPGPVELDSYYPDDAAL